MNMLTYTVGNQHYFECGMKCTPLWYENEINMPLNSHWNWHADEYSKARFSVLVCHRDHRRLFLVHIKTKFFVFWVRRDSKGDGGSSISQTSIPEYFVGNNSKLPPGLRYMRTRVMKYRCWWLYEDFKIDMLSPHLFYPPLFPLLQQPSLSTKLTTIVVVFAALTSIQFIEKNVKSKIIVAVVNGGSST